jgi:hypothetical protein
MGLLPRKRTAGQEADTEQTQSRQIPHRATSSGTDYGAQATRQAAGENAGVCLVVAIRICAIPAR